MTENNSPKKNFIYNLLYQIFILIIPLITAPYLARVIGAEGVGVYSYTYSIVYYFMMFVLLGVNNYGNRAIAKVRDNKETRSKIFLEIYSLQLILGIIISFIYFIFIFCIKNEYIDILKILYLYILSSMLDINWFFFGLEEFKKTVTRNVFVKIISLVLIFIFIKEKTDLWKYVFILSFMAIVSKLIMWKYVPENINFTKINIKDVFKHLKPNLILFVPVIAVSFYKIMDKIMLGVMAGVEEVGYYENAEKIINIPMSLITALGTVMLPRMSNIVANGENEKMRQYLKKSIVFIMFLAFPMMFGLVTIGYKFSIIYFGSEFKKTGVLIMLLSTTIPFMAFANVIRTQYLVPNEKEKIFIKSVVLGAIVNFIVNMIFIPKYLSIGACLGTIIAESIVMLYQTISVRNVLPIKEYLSCCTIFFIKAIIMYLVIMIFRILKLENFIEIILQIIIGTVLYVFLNIEYVFSICGFNKKLIKEK